VLLAILVAFLLNRPVKPQSPAFEPASNPFAKGIFANGMIESAQSSGSNTNIFPEVTGPIVTIYVKAGEAVRAGQPLFAIDDSVQRATTEQARLLAQGASAQLAELKAQPRRETLAVAASQLDEAQANLATLVHQRDKLARSAAVDPRSVSRNSLDSAIDAAAAARKASDVAKRQYDLTKAGAWTYDIQNQAAQYASLNHAWEADKALLAKYVVKAPSDGAVLAINAATGGYVSPLGTYDTYTQMNVPVAVLGQVATTLQVRCYVDEILLSRIPKGGHIDAEMRVRGADYRTPLQFVRIEPYVVPKIELSNERQEQVDLRVLPVIFRFPIDPKFRLYPGEEVDVYINEQ